MAQMESLDTYTFDLRRGLRDAARVGLGQLEEMIGEIGYGWLDGHMEGILERTSRLVCLAYASFFLGDLIDRLSG